MNIDSDAVEFFTEIYKVKDEFVESGMAEKVGKDIRKLASFISDMISDEAVKSYKKFLDADMDKEHAAALTLAMYSDMAKNIERGIKNVRINL